MGTALIRWLGWEPTRSRFPPHVRAHEVGDGEHGRRETGYRRHG
jgi:hypothetical protein